MNVYRDIFTYPLKVLYKAHAWLTESVPSGALATSKAKYIKFLERQRLNQNLTLKPNIILKFNLINI